MAESSDKQMLTAQYDIIRALVAKFGRDVTLTKAEFMESYGEHLTIQHYEGEMILRVWTSLQPKPSVVSTAARSHERLS